eukprot:1299533-Amphidinium_carterae.1
MGPAMNMKSGQQTERWAKAAQETACPPRLLASLSLCKLKVLSNCTDLSMPLNLNSKRCT